MQTQNTERKIQYNTKNSWHKYNLFMYFSIYSVYGILFTKVGQLKEKITKVNGDGVEVV